MKRQNRIAIFNIASTVLLNGISIVTGPVFTRLLGGSGYGALRIYNIWVGIITVVFTLQTQATLANARVEYPESAQKQYQSSVMSLSVLVFALCTGLVVLFQEAVSAVLGLEKALIYLMLLQAFGTFCVNFLNIKNVYEFRAGWNMLLSLAVTVVSLVLALILVLQMPMQTRYYGRVIANAATYGVLGIPVCLVILSRGKTLFHRDYWKFCLILAIPSVFQNLSDLIQGVIDQIMLQHMKNLTTVGHYSSALMLSNFLLVIFRALNNTWCPFFFEEMKAGKREAMLEKTRNFLEVFTVLACGFILLAPEVFHVYAPAEYWTATNMIPLFVAGYYLIFLSTFPVNFEMYHKKSKVTAIVTVISSVLNITLNYVLILKLDMIGAAWATMICHGVQLALHHFYTSRVLGKEGYPFPFSLWAKYGIGYCVIMAVVFLLPNAMLLRWGIGGILGILELLRVRRRKVLI